MSKVSSLDDTALIDAFDRAIASFKAMHNQVCQANSSAEEENQIIEINEAATCTDITKEYGEIEQDYENNNVPKNASEPEETVEGKDVISTDFKAETDTCQEQNAEYNELLRKYYEIEEQRQSILQQLQLHSNYYQNSSFTDSYWGSYDYSSQSCGVSTADSTDIKAGMAVAESALNSVKTILSGSGDSASSQKNETENSKDESDLLALLNVWYCAGFHTARYLLDQSKKNSH